MIECDSERILQLSNVTSKRNFKIVVSNRVDISESATTMTVTPVYLCVSCGSIGIWTYAANKDTIGGLLIRWGG